MVKKLLDFAGFFKDFLEDDVGNSHTYDLPYLRYSGPHYVFLWDENRDYQNYNPLIGYSKPESVSMTAQTVDPFLPFRNGGRKENINHFLPTGLVWPTVVADSEAMFPAPGLPLGGRLLRVRLPAFIKLDTYYSNGICSFRKRIPVRANGVTYKAWTYFTPIEKLCKYDPHEKKYRMGSGFTIRPCNKAGPKSNQYYVSDKV